MARIQHCSQPSWISARRRSARKNRSPCLTGIPRSNQQEGANLIDDASALADQSLAHAMHSLQIELFGSLRCHKLHRRALNGLGDRLRIAEVGFCPFEYGRTYLAGINRAS